MPINQQEESKIIEKTNNSYTETFCSREIYVAHKHGNTFNLIFNQKKANKA